MFGDEIVESRGEFSLVRVCSRSARPLLVELTVPIGAFGVLIGRIAENLSPRI
jgi:hypothetical protein